MPSEWISQISWMFGFLRIAVCVFQPALVLTWSVMCFAALFCHSIFSLFRICGHALHYPKILRWKRCGELLSLSEYLTNSYHRTSEYKDAGIIVNDLTENQILDSVKESWERLTGYWNSTSEEKECDERFKEILKAHSSFRNFHGFVHPESRLATTFLKFSGRSFLT